MTIEIRDATGITKAMQSVVDGQNEESFITVSREFELAVSMGQVPGFSTQDKFGLNPLIEPSTDPEDVWEGGGTYQYSTTDDIVSVSSSDVGDTQDVTVLGLDSGWNEVEQTVTLNGQTRVALTTPLLRVYRMVNDGNTDFVGTVYCYSGTTNTNGVPSGDSVEKARITNGYNQTLMAIYTLPEGKVGFLYRGELGIELEGGPRSTVDFARIFYKSRRFGKVFAVKKAITVSTSGSSIFQDRRSFPDVIPARTDIKLSVQEVSDDMGVWGTFDIMLVDQDKLTPAFLAAIGQPGV